jgi:hypothetical protein
MVLPSVGDPRSLRSFSAGKAQEDFAAHFPITTKTNCRISRRRHRTSLTIAGIARNSERPVIILAMTYDRYVL